MLRSGSSWSARTNTMTIEPSWSRSTMTNWLRDETACPLCHGRGLVDGHAHAYLNYRDGLWAFCIIHHVRWYVTRFVIGFADVTEQPAGGLQEPRAFGRFVIR